MTATILAADDSRTNLMILERILKRAGYKVIASSCASEVLEIVQGIVPDLFLLDIMMPNMSGLDLCRRLKEDSRLARIPVIFLTAKKEQDDVIEGFNAGAVDYVSKPFNSGEILARIGTHIKLYHALLEIERLRKQDRDANPLTGLPGNNSINQAINLAIENKEDTCVVYGDLDNFKAYNDTYGFSLGDEILLYCSKVIQEITRNICGDGVFVGHIGGDDFVFIVPSDKARPVGEAIAARFDRDVGLYYNETDRASGYINALDRQGQPIRYPFVSISMAAVHLLRDGIEHHLQVATVCTELKKVAKKKTGSKIVFNQRKLTDSNPPIFSPG